MTDTEYISRGTRFQHLHRTTASEARVRCDACEQDVRYDSDRVTGQSVQECGCGRMPMPRVEPSPEDKARGQRTDRRAVLDERTCSCGETFTVRKDSSRTLCDPCFADSRIATRRSRTAGQNPITIKPRRT